MYLGRPAANDIVPRYPVDARWLFYSWLLLSIFILDWAKSAIAGFEASALMTRTLAPANAMQLMWHTDRAWGNLSGWWKALGAVYQYIRHRLVRREGAHVWGGPSLLWWYLALSSFLLYAGIPLAGLSMDPKEGLRLTDRNIIILGTNQSSFDTPSSNSVAERASSRWRQGNPTTPHGDTIFYAPEGTANVSSTYYDDYIQGVCGNQDTKDFPPLGPITFFSGPEVSERAHGNAWGLQMSLSCSVAHPYRELNMLKVESINTWKVEPVANGIPASSSFSYGNSPSTVFNELQLAGLVPALFYVDQSFGVSYQYLMASSSEIEGGSSYIDSASLPLHGSVELVMWQSYQSPFTPDAAFGNLSTHPSVVSSYSPITNATYLGYGIKCSVTSDVGSADLSAATRTYSNFKRDPAIQASSAHLGAQGLTQYSGILDIESLVFAAFTTATLEYLGPPICMPGASATCNPWYGANVATNGIPLAIDNPSIGSRDIQYPTISPERMQLAIYKLFGEAAIALMASGPGLWTGNLTGLQPTNYLVPGKVPYTLVIILLGIWTFITALPSCWTLFERRWAATLDGFEMFRLGAEWRDVVWKFEGSEITENKILTGVPGMVGDMDPRGERGFVGLSWTEARVKGRRYTYDRASIQR